jgi:hypothetical protein
MPRRFLVAPALALLILSLVACGGGSSAPSSTGAGAGADTAAATAAATTAPAAPDAGGVQEDKTPGTDLDACQIVTAKDIAAAIATSDVPDGTFKKTPNSLSPGSSLCKYVGDFGQVEVALVPEDGANLYDAARGSYEDASDMSGIGDGAFNSIAHHRAFVWKGHVAVMLTMFLMGSAEQLPVATDLAKDVIAKL